VKKAAAVTVPPKLRLGVNIDHVATLRNARGGPHPDPLRAAEIAIAAGADGITAHLREDRRHIRDDDIARLKAAIDRPLNLEMAATREMVDIATRIRPHAACIVPERRQERTTEGGLDAVGQQAQLRPQVEELRAAGIRKRAAAEFDRIRDAARHATDLGLEVHAGHGLDYATAERIAGLPEIVELNIGHYLVGEAIFDGLAAVLGRMRAAMDRGRLNLERAS
jgi:pyridoxine 5-phosphate synthase